MRTRGPNRPPGRGSRKSSPTSSQPSPRANTNLVMSSTRSGVDKAVLESRRLPFLNSARCNHCTTLLRKTSLVQSIKVLECGEQGCLRHGSHRPTPKGPYRTSHCVTVEKTQKDDVLNSVSLKCWKPECLQWEARLHDILGTFTTDDWVPFMARQHNASSSHFTA
jgi:hypothetical protein